ncbi:hypothetical protein V8C34DRAFT_289502 [Trichoderma compactum]
MSNFSVVGPIKNSYHFYHEGAESKPDWAFAQARKDVEAQWGTFLSGLPDTSTVRFGDFGQTNLGGKIGRSGAWVQLPSVTGAGSKTKKEMGVRSWKCWFDIHYEITFYFISGEVGTQVPGGFSSDEVNAAIRDGTKGSVV